MYICTMYIYKDDMHFIAQYSTGFYFDPIRLKLVFYRTVHVLNLIGLLK